MQTFDQHLMEMVSGEVVTYETALVAATNPKDFEIQMRTLRRRARVAAPTDAARAPAADRPASFTDGLSRLLPGQRRRRTSQGSSPPTPRRSTAPPGTSRRVTGPATPCPGLRRGRPPTCWREAPR